MSLTLYSCLYSCMSKTGSGGWKVAQSESSLETFWQQVEQELGQVPPSADVRHNAFYSEAEWDVFEVRYSSLGGYRLFAWLSIPKGGGPFPGLVQMPDYGSAVDIPYTSLRRDMIVLNATHRGQRGSDTPFQAHYPGLLTEGIASPDTYILREVYADAVRSVDLLLGRHQVAQVARTTQDDNGWRIAAAGSGLGGTLAIVAGAFRPQVQALAVDTPIMIGAPGFLDMAGGYPLEEVQDYIRTYPQQQEAVLKGLEGFSPLALADRVGCPVLLSVGERDGGQCPPALGDELARNLIHGELHKYPGGSEGGGHLHSLVRTRWLRDQMGL